MFKYSILIADDNKNYCEYLVQKFTKSGKFHVLPPVHSGDAAIDILTNEPVDILLLDIVMPKYDGMWVLEQIEKTELAQKPLLIIHSIISLDVITRRATELGAAYYFLKPTDFEIMEKRILEIAGEDVYNQEVQTTAVQLDIEKKVTDMIHEVAIPAHLNGYQYLRSAILMSAQNMDLLRGITTIIYPAVAQQYGTTPSRVERAIRHAIEVAWNRGNIDTLQKFFGYTIKDDKGKPTNGEFIAMIADRAKMQMH